MKQPLLTFHSINALRFFAFLSVFLLHIPSFEGNPFLGKIILGGNVSGVDFFFTLSGFLITYLLCYEKLQNGKINGKKYFFRRSLRIWPLYFIGTGIAYFNNYISQRFHLGNPDGYSPNPLFSLTFLENYQMIRHNNFPNGAPLQVFWSLCVEEHFYILWFFVFTLIPIRYLPKTFCVLWSVGIAYRIWFRNSFPEKTFNDIDILSKMDFFCAAALSGWMIATNIDRVKAFFIKIPVYLRIFSLMIVVLLFYSNLLFPWLPHQYIYMPALSAILYTLILLVAITTSWLNFNEQSFFSRLGKISYGLYVFHTVVLVSLFAIFKLEGIQIEGMLITILFAATALLLSIVLSALSYRYFEKPFLQLKSRYRVN